MNSYTGNMDGERVNGLTDHIERKKTETLRDRVAELEKENKDIKREIAALKTQKRFSIDSDTKQG